MNLSNIHPNWNREPLYITEGFSIEITAKDADNFKLIADRLPSETPISVTFLAGEDLEMRLAATKLIRESGFEPMPHFSARRLKSAAEFEEMLATITLEARVRRCFVICGDKDKPDGPYEDSTALIETGMFERYGIKAIGIAGHPEEHPNMSEKECWDVLASKCDLIQSRGMTPLIVTQFGFDAQRFLDWLVELRSRGIDAPVRIGIPGPASIKSLLRFAASCGVEASASVLSKYGISLGKLIGKVGPENMIDYFADHLGPEHGPVRLHFYPFGGLSRLLEWLEKYEAR